LYAERQISDLIISFVSIQWAHYFSCATINQHSCICTKAAAGGQIVSAAAATAMARNNYNDHGHDRERRWRPSWLDRQANN
jgi:hypothetical protein